MQNYFFLFLFSTGTLVFGQTCGFGCLGFSGAYAGYTYQQVEPNGINRVIADKSFNNNDDSFKETKGFRFGINVFQARFENFYFGSKIYYQLLNNKKDVLVSADGNFNKYTLRTNYYGSSLDMGLILHKSFYLKLVEVGINVNKTALKEEVYVNDVMVKDNKYEVDDVNFGYSVSSGFVLHLIQNYINTEFTVGYSFMEIEKLIDDNSNRFINQQGIKAIENGGFFISLQVSAGIPLN